MSLLERLKNLFIKSAHPASAEDIDPTDYQHISFRVGIVEFADNVESDSGKVLGRLLGQSDSLQVFYIDEPFGKAFLSLESRTIFDMIDRGQDRRRRHHLGLPRRRQDSPQLPNRQTIRD